MLDYEILRIIWWVLVVVLLIGFSVTDGFDMGVTPGAEIYLRKLAPLGDPLEITVRGYELTLRKAEASCVCMEVKNA